MVKNNTGLTPLMAAAEHCQIPVFDYLFEHSSAILSHEEKIDALELLGKYVNIIVLSSGGTRNIVGQKMKIVQGKKIREIK